MQQEHKKITAEFIIVCMIYTGRNHILSWLSVHMYCGLNLNTVEIYVGFQETLYGYVINNKQTAALQNTSS